MCIVLLTTSHPSYPLILLNNRDVSTTPFPFHKQNKIHK